MLALLVAGSDTTANLLRVALFLLATTPRVYRKLQTEIDQGIASGQISNPVTGAQGKSLSFLQAFLQECLRFNPPVSLLFPKVVPPEGDTLDGTFIPGGTKIGTDFWSMGRRADIFGADVSVFRPERFLEASPTERTRMEKTTDLMFGYGRYMCPGKAMAWLEMNKLFVEVKLASPLVGAFANRTAVISSSGILSSSFWIPRGRSLVLIAHCSCSGICRFASLGERVEGTEYQWQG